MELFKPDIEHGLALAKRVNPKYAPVWEGRSPAAQAAMAMYFLPHRSAKEVIGVTRPRVIKWYCPFADQRTFPAGHRYCINVYTGCSHGCVYCYAAGYEPNQPGCKKNFERMLLRDLADLDTFDVPPAPVHLSNSTDAFQEPLETQAGHTGVVLENLFRHRHRFTTVTVLTKNPLLASLPNYTELLQKLKTLPAGHPRFESFEAAGLPALRVEVSLAFWRDEMRDMFDPGAPPVESRLDGIRRLRDAGIPIVLRIDPLLPRSPLGAKSMADFGLPEPQPLDDLDRLLAFAADVGIMHVVYSVAKITRPRGGGLSDTMTNMLAAYRHLAGPAGLKFRGGSWRLPQDVAQEQVVEPFLDLCRKHGLAAKYCTQNLITAP